MSYKNILSPYTTLVWVVKNRRVVWPGGKKNALFLSKHIKSQSQNCQSHRHGNPCIRGASRKSSSVQTMGWYIFWKLIPFLFRMLFSREISSVFVLLKFEMSFKKKILRNKNKKARLQKWFCPILVKIPASIVKHYEDLIHSKWDCLIGMS